MPATVLKKLSRDPKEGPNGQRPQCSVDGESSRGAGSVCYIALDIFL